MKKLNNIMENIWLLIAIVSAIWIGFTTIVDGYEAAKPWMPVPLIAGAMFAFRRFFRKRMERHQDGM